MSNLFEPYKLLVLHQNYYFIQIKRKENWMVDVFFFYYTDLLPYLHIFSVCRMMTNIYSCCICFVLCSICAKNDSYIGICSWQNPATVSVKQTDFLTDLFIVNIIVTFFFIFKLNLQTWSVVPWNKILHNFHVTWCELIKILLFYFVILT